MEAEANGGRSLRWISSPEAGLSDMTGGWVLLTVLPLSFTTDLYGDWLRFYSAGGFLR